MIAATLILYVPFSFLAFRSSHKLKSNRLALSAPSRLLHTSLNISPNSKASLDAHGRPPINSIIQGWNVIGDTSWMLDFAVVGFPKCGTTTLMHHLQSHPEVRMFDYERCELGTGQHVPLLCDLHNISQANSKVGLKCAKDLDLSAKVSLDRYKSLFPKTRLIVGIRHPVLW
jgi:hypothetical protein